MTTLPRRTVALSAVGKHAGFVGRDWGIAPAHLLPVCNAVHDRGRRFVDRPGRRWYGSAGRSRFTIANICAAARRRRRSTVVSTFRELKSMPKKRAPLDGSGKKSDVAGSILSDGISFARCERISSDSCAAGSPRRTLSRIDASRRSNSRTRPVPPAMLSRCRDVAASWFGRRGRRAWYQAGQLEGPVERSGCLIPHCHRRAINVTPDITSEWQRKRRRAACGLN